MLTLGGQVIDKCMLTVLRKLDKEQVEAITIDDYRLLARVCQDKNLADIQPSQFTNLLKLGIVKQTDLGIELVNGQLTIAIGKRLTSDREKQIIAFVAENGKTKERLKLKSQRLIAASDFSFISSSLSEIASRIYI